MLFCTFNIHTLHLCTRLFWCCHHGNSFVTLSQDIEVLNSVSCWLNSDLLSIIYHSIYHSRHLEEVDKLHICRSSLDFLCHPLRSSLKHWLTAVTSQLGTFTSGVAPEERWQQGGLRACVEECCLELERWRDSWSEPARGKAACRLAYCLCS